VAGRSGSSLAFASKKTRHSSRVLEKRPKNHSGSASKRVFGVCGASFAFRVHGLVRVAGSSAPTTVLCENRTVQEVHCHRQHNFVARVQPSEGEDERPLHSREQQQAKRGPSARRACHRIPRRGRPNSGRFEIRYARVPPERTQIGKVKTLHPGARGHNLQEATRSSLCRAPRKDLPRRTVPRSSRGPRHRRGQRTASRAVPSTAPKKGLISARRAESRPGAGSRQGSRSTTPRS